MAQAKIDSVQNKYPSLRLLSELRSSPNALVWEGWVQPIRSTENLDGILDDLDNDREVEFSRDGELEHNRKCKIKHTEHRLIDQLTSITRLFKIRVVDYGDGRMPMAWVLEPTIKKDSRRHTRGKNGICGFAPWEFPWNPNTSSMIEFIDHLLIWLFKWNVFAQTGQWVGRELQHDPKFLLKTINPTQSCHCGNGKTYESCHRLTDGTSLFGELWIRFEAWLAVHNSRVNRFHI